MTLDDAVIAFLYKWDRLEKLNHITIIDFDLIQVGNKYPGQFKSREEAREKLENIINTYKSELKNDDFLAAQLHACLTFLEVLMGKIMPFRDYVDNTLGIRPEYIPQEDIQKQYDL